MDTPTPEDTLKAVTEHLGRIPKLESQIRSVSKNNADLTAANKELRELNKQLQADLVKAQQAAAVECQRADSFAAHPDVIAATKAARQRQAESLEAQAKQIRSELESVN